MLLDLNDTSQTPHCWNDGWRPSKIIAHDGQRTMKTPQKIEALKVCKKNRIIDDGKL